MDPKTTHTHGTDEITYQGSTVALCDFGLSSSSVFTNPWVRSARVHPPAFVGLNQFAVIRASCM